MICPLIKTLSQCVHSAEHVFLIVNQERSEHFLWYAAAVSFGMKALCSLWDKVAVANSCKLGHQRVSGNQIIVWIYGKNCWPQSPPLNHTCTGVKSPLSSFGWDRKTPLKMYKCAAVWDIQQRYLCHCIYISVYVLEWSIKLRKLPLLRGCFLAFK